MSCSRGGMLFGSESPEVWALVWMGEDVKNKNEKEYVLWVWVCM